MSELTQYISAFFFKVTLRSQVVQEGTALLQAWLQSVMFPEATVHCTVKAIHNLGNGHVTAVAEQSLFEQGRTFVQCCTVFLYSTFVSYCTLHSTNCTQFRQCSCDCCGCANKFI